MYYTSAFWDFINTVTRFDYRGFIDKVWNEFENVLYIHRSYKTRIASTCFTQIMDMFKQLLRLSLTLYILKIANHAMY